MRDGTHPRRSRLVLRDAAAPYRTTEPKETAMDQDAIKNAEAKIAEVQAALDNAQRVLQAAERAQETAQKSAEVARTVALAAIVGLVLVALALGLRRKHR